MKVTTGSRSLDEPAMLATISLIVLLAILPRPALAGKTAPASGNETVKSFKLNCSSCHGVNGDGEASLGKTLKAADLRSPEVQKQSDAQLARGYRR